jgi:hypothetical protein
MAWVVFTNHADAMPLEGDDRRFYVVEVRHPLWPNTRPTDVEKRAYFAPLHAWIEDGGAALVFRHLLDRDLSAFDHANPPPDTQAKHDMRRAAMSVFSQWMADECERGLYAKRSVVCAREVQDHAADSHQDRANTRGIKGGLEAGGFQYYGVIPAVPGHEKRNVRIAVYVRDAALVSASAEKLRTIMLDEMAEQTRDLVFGDWRPDGWTAPETPMERLRRSLHAGGNVFSLRSGTT